MDSIDWNATPRWSRQLQFDANLGEIYPWSCAEVGALSAKQKETPAQDEFDKRERETAMSKAESDCLARTKSEAKPLPALVRVDITVKLIGEFDFKNNSFPMRLTPNPEKDSALISIREADTAYVDGSRILALMGEPDNGKSKDWTLPYLSGVAIEDAPEKFFPAKNEFNLPVTKTDIAKQLKPRLQKSGAVVQIVVAPGDPKKGTGIAYQKGDSPLAMLTQDRLRGVRARPVALRFVVDGEVVAGPFDIQQ